MDEYLNKSIIKHAAQRMAQRNISIQAIKNALSFGNMIHSAGVLHYFLGKKHIPIMQRCGVENAENYDGIVVLVDSLSGTVITVYRNKQAQRNIKRKAKYNKKK